jgi:hypothetical protein
VQHALKVEDSKIAQCSLLISTLFEDKKHHEKYEILFFLTRAQFSSVVSKQKNMNCAQII